MARRLGIGGEQGLAGLGIDHDRGEWRVVAPSPAHPVVVVAVVPARLGRRRSHEAGDRRQDKGCRNAQSKLAASRYAKQRHTQDPNFRPVPPAGRLGHTRPRAMATFL